jgi:hypothetical protein
MINLRSDPSFLRMTNSKIIMKLPLRQRVNLLPIELKVQVSDTTMLIVVLKPVPKYFLAKAQRENAKAAKLLT